LQIFTPSRFIIAPVSSIMNHPPHGLIALLAAGSLVSLGLASCSSHQEAGSAPRQAGRARTASFTRDVKPVLESKCLACHSGDSAPWGFRLESRDFAFARGLSGARIEPGNPAHSLLVQLSTAHRNSAAMPLRGAPLTEEETDMLRRWISEGAEWPQGRAGQLKPAPGSTVPGIEKMREEWKGWMEPGAARR
jgi:hypothetical protein